MESSGKRLEARRTDVPGSIRVQLCGEFMFDFRGERIEARIRGRQGKLLLAYLLLNRGRSISRDELLEAVWPDAPRARSADLSTLLSRLRSMLPPGAHLEGRSELRLVLPPDTWIDFEVANEAAARAEAAMPRHDWRGAWGPALAALSICDRELLPGFDADWIERRRDDLADLSLEVLESMAQVGLRLGGSELATAERSARRLIEMSPLRESGYMILMEVQEARGNGAEALQTYESLRERLRDDLGASPGALARELHERLLAGAGGDPATGEQTERTPREVAAEARRLPPALTTPARVGFVGRERDLARLRLLLERTGELPCQLALLSGEPGIGKTRLLSQFGRAAHEQGAVVLYGRADEDGVVPYAPFVDALRGETRKPPAEGSQVEPPGDGEVLRLLLGGSELGGGAGTEGSGDASLARLRFFDAISRLLDEIAGGAPLILALDDLHWADGSTLLLLKHLMRDQRRHRLLVVAGFRDSEPARSDLSALITDLARDLPVERLRLRALAGSEIALIAREAAGEDLSDEAIGAIGAEAEGNPFYALELASHMRDDNRSTGAGPASPYSPLRPRLPDSVNEVIGRRLTRLGERTQLALANGAVLGREFELALVEPLAGLSANEAVGAVEEAMSAGLIDEVPTSPDRFSFSHALIRSVLYEDLSSARRIRLHERAAQMLEQRRANPEASGFTPGATAEIAFHHLAALPRGDPERALSFVEQAVREAIGLLAYEEAIEHCREGLVALDRHLPGAGRRRLELLVHLCDAERLAGRMVDARSTAAEAIEAAREQGDAEALARAVLAHGGAGFESAFVDEHMVALLEEALEAVGGDDGLLRVSLLARLAKALHYAEDEEDRERRFRLGTEAMTMAERLGDLRAILVALEGSHFALSQPDNLEERLVAARRIIALAAELDDSAYELLGRYFLIADLVEVGDLAAADEVIAEYGERAAAVHSSLHRWYHARFLGMRALLAGDFEEAERRIQEAFALGSAVEPKTATMHFAAQMWALNRERASVASIEQPARGFVVEYPAVPAWRLALSWALLEQGRDEEAAEIFAEFTRSSFRVIPTDAIWTMTITMAAELAAAGLGDEAALRDLIGLMAPYGDRNAVTGEAIVSGGPMSLYVGMVALKLGDLDRAEEELERAVSEARRIEAAPFELRALSLLAATLRKRGGDSDARASAMADQAEAARLRLGSAPPALGRSVG